MAKFTLASGDSVEFTRTDTGYDVCLRDSNGTATVTVDMTDDTARYLMSVADAHGDYDQVDVTAPWDTEPRYVRGQRRNGR